MSIYELANNIAAEAAKDPEGICSTLEFKLIDCKEAGEHWANNELYSRGVDTHGVCILVDGEELVGHRKVGHMSPDSLYYELTQGLTWETPEFDQGAYLYACETCGLENCENYTCYIRERDDFIIWISPDGNYVFRKDNYFKEIEKLKSWKEERQVQHEQEHRENLL